MVSIISRRHQSQMTDEVGDERSGRGHHLLDVSSWKMHGFGGTPGTQPFSFKRWTSVKAPSLITSNPDGGEEDRGGKKGVFDRRTSS
ncbi:hypothetical protein AVEN_136648-1 [Araneus ventricosus]|uniref:Uncharacterized protein n=1 Tax=Araneus ventricosus TaxID=182803 RepID=A0A4Y2C9K2_ARAVE|nr:hypothetical protein AVEN_136648-1 [Araneus ventricosus]